MNGICSAELGRRYATRFAFDVVKPALKRGATFIAAIAAEVAAALDRDSEGLVDCTAQSNGRFCSAEFVAADALQDTFAIMQETGRDRVASVDCRYAASLSAVADGERSPAIHRRVSVENGPLVASRRLNRNGIASNSMNDICSAEFGRRYATRFCSAVVEPALKRGSYARLPLSRHELSALADYERSPAIYRRVFGRKQPLVA